MSQGKGYAPYLLLISSILAVFFLFIETRPLSVYLNGQRPVVTLEPVIGDRKAGSSATLPAAAELNPAKPPQRQKKDPSPSGILPGFPIDLNRATKGELMMLPGVGEKTAERIIEKRAELGGFSSVEELTEVKWIGKVKLERMRGLVKVSAPGKPE